MNEQHSVREIMSGSPLTIGSSAKLLDAALLLRRSGIRHLLVVDGEKLVGILSERDVQRCAPSRLIPIGEDAYNAVFENTTVIQVMTREPNTITASATLVEVIATMQETHHGCLPVMDGERLVGIVTRWDVIEAFRRILSGEPVSRVHTAKD